MEGNSVAGISRKFGNRLAGCGAWRRGTIAAGMAVLLASCQGIDVYPNRVDESAFQPSNNPVTVDSVQRNNKLAALARAQHPRILATYGGEYSDPKLERMVAKVVGNLTTVAGNPGQAYRITILNSPNVNAFALPGGYLYVTRGLLALANDSAELAAVLAHEMGHVTANHGIARQQAEAEAELATKAATELFGASPVAEVTALRGKLRLAQFSRNQELEADVIGIRSAGQAGFDPYAAVRFLQSMAAYSNLRSVSGATDASLDFLATHPNTPQRIDLAERHARDIGAKGVGTVDRDAYLAGIDGLLFGDTAEEGYVRGHTFLHPELGVSFSVPQGFVIDNSAAAVTANGPGNIAIRFDGVALQSSISLPDYLRSGWVTGLEPETIRTVTINGNEAAIARARADNWQFDIAVIRAGSQVYRLLTAAPVASDKLETVARAVSDSFRLLSASEKAALKPLRIKIVTARAGDTVGSLASRMVGVDRKEELFRVLNGMPTGNQIPAGFKVKIVTDR
ncbi:MAG: M48 family metalloprotease [Rhizobiaceae bacterium]|nr:M48 family metalloprotease [Rhizobiaceae bacterium]